MAYKLYGREVFTAKVNNTEYTFTCYTQNTSYGFRHICTESFNNTEEARWIKRDILNKCCYYNRTWECFRYQTVLRGAIEKLNAPKQDKELLKTILIERKQIEAQEEAEAFVKDFKATYDSLSDKNKEILKNTPHLETQEQAENVLGVMKMMSAFEQLGL